MNPNLLPLSVIAAVALLISPQTSEATSYTFDVDATSGIGTGSFTIDLPDSWPVSEKTLIPASSFRGFFARGDKWTSLTVSLNVIIEQFNNAELSGGCKKAVSFKLPGRGIGLLPVDAVDALPGVTLRTGGVTQSGISRQRQNPWLEKKDRLIRSGGFWNRQNPRVSGRVGLGYRMAE